MLSRSTKPGVFDPSGIVHTGLVLNLDLEAKNWLGDYIGAVYHDGKLSIAYTDDSASDSHVSFFQAAVP